MKPALRNIAVTVVESRSGRFGWQLLEQDAKGRWSLLEQGEDDGGDYARAMATGLLRLQQIVDDLAVGPRRKGAAAASKADPVESEPEVQSGEPGHEPEPERDSPTRKGTAFGFGSGV